MRPPRHRSRRPRDGTLADSHGVFPLLSRPCPNRPARTVRRLSQRFDDTAGEGGTGLDITSPAAPRQGGQSLRSRSDGTDPGAASDVNVATFTRFARRIGLPGRPGPHSRPRLQPPSRHRATTAAHKAAPAHHSGDARVLRGPSHRPDGSQIAPASLRRMYSLRLMW